MATLQKALFLDRDGIINVDHGYVHRIKTFEFTDGIFEFCRAAKQAGYLIIVVTNQSGIGRGYYTEAQFTLLSEWMNKQFEAQQCALDDIYYCPHHPKKALPPYLTDCDCRKPKPGMLLNAIQQHQIDPTQSIMVGDSLTDIQAANAAKINTTVWVNSQNVTAPLSVNLTHNVQSTTELNTLNLLVKNEG